ncbi:MAG: HAD family hydrolase [Bacteroidales bacterium]|jgi:HAD superfamily hydrolase (TIGR01549 family)|nr:HAD family hydrolase [Bacteroidales bacterium]
MTSKVIHIDGVKLDNIDCVVFDKDGTLIDIHHYWGSMIKLRAKLIINSLYSAWNEDIYCEVVSSMGLGSDEKLKPEGPVGIKPREYIENTVYNVLLKYEPSVTLDFVKDCFKQVDQQSEESISELIRALPNSVSLLKDLKSCGYKIALATTDISERAVIAMNQIGVHEIFDVILGGNNVTNKKPNPEMINRICDHFGYTADRILMVGDSIVDQQMAENANAKFLGVKTGLIDECFIDKSEYLVKDLNSVKLL